MINHVSSVLPLNFCVALVLRAYHTEYWAYDPHYRILKLYIGRPIAKMPMQCQEEYLPGQILQKHVMQCWFLPMLCQSQGINNCYNHCLSTFADPWFILINWWIMVPFDGFATTQHCGFPHPRVTWHLFPVVIRVQHSVFTVAQWAARTLWCKGSQTPKAQVCAKCLWSIKT